MTTTTTQTGAWIEDFERFERETIGAAWLAPVRKAAIARFVELGFPTTRDEEWRLTNVAPIATSSFVRPSPGAGELRAADLQPLFLPGAAARLVIVNGRFSRGFSLVEPSLDGVSAGSLATAVKAGPDAVAQHLARHADCRQHAFTALNTAFLEDGAFVHVPAGRIVEQPIHIVYLSTAAAEPIVAHPRALVVAGVGSRVTIVETYASIVPDGSLPPFATQASGLRRTPHRDGKGLGADAKKMPPPQRDRTARHDSDAVMGRSLTNAVTEIVAGDNAVVDHCRLQLEQENALHIGALHLHQGRDSRVSSHSVTIGGALHRNDVHALLAGEGAECTLNGLFLLHGRQHADNHLRVEHAAPRTASREFYKGILDDESTGVFTGRIVVHRQAQKTDAKQSNMNLLLSRTARIDTKPQLEIRADDVKCTHGATIGQIDEEAVFYLRSRGIGREAARSLLVYAFADESVAAIGVEAVRDRLRRIVAGRLPHGESVGETQ